MNPTDVLFALTGIRDIPTGFALHGYLLFGIHRIISLQLFVFTGVHTLVMISANMRRRSLSPGHSTGTTCRVNEPGTTSTWICLKIGLVLTISNRY